MPGRLDNEKRARRLVAMFQALPPSLGAAMVLIGDGKLRDRLVARRARLADRLPGFESSRGDLARALASADIYVSAMADETFGISVIEAQACGLPVVGVASGAMPDRVPPGLGLLGPVDDARAMAANVVELWNGDLTAAGLAARAHVADRYSWPRTFDTLFNEIYPNALRHARARTASGHGWRHSGDVQDLVAAG